ncbi:hypothetical protein J6TS2_30500 [Heyndrickxia sporothermodurans]|nr:hypothetical protein J6TS2_30500 [Heyndrickxia sporothermodurans]
MENSAIDIDQPTNTNEIIETHSTIENIERLNLFVKNVQSNKKDSIRLTRYTTEGDPIFHDLDYHDQKLTFKLDTTQDKFGHGKVETYYCKSIQKKETSTETKYILEGCPDTQINELISISHNVDQEDYFAFVLKYGVGKKNSIDTKHHKIIKVLQNGETSVINDFQLSKEELNKIYKLMIFTNYLGEKKLSSKCNQASIIEYELTIWINSGKRQFEWSECDHSKDGKEMTQLALNILEILEKNPTYQSLN